MRLRGLADRDPSEVRVWFGLGYAYLQAGRLDDADGAFRRSLGLLPVADAALLGRALIAAKRGDDRAAVDYCRRALAINPGSASA